MKRKSIGTSVTGSDGGSSRSMRPGAGELPAYPFYAICVENGEHDVFLHLGRPYKVVRPRKLDPPYLFRVIDEEGEDYLYPRDWFVPVELKPSQKRRINAALASLA